MDLHPQAVVSISPYSFRARWLDPVRDLPHGARVILQCVHQYHSYDDDDDHDTTATRMVAGRHCNEQEELRNTMAKALQGRWIQKGTVLILTAVTNAYATAVVVRDIQRMIQEQSSPPVDAGEDCCYRVGDPDSYSLEVVTVSPFADESSLRPSGNDDICIEKAEDEDDPDMMPTSITECPGYESLVDDLVHLLQLPSASARPSGILLTGCAGVGKTRLVQCVTDQLLLKNRTNNNNHNRWSIHRVSAHHLVLQASWATEEDLLASLQPPTLLNDDRGQHRSLLVIDDLDAVGTENDDDNSTFSTSNDHERQLVRNSILQAVDRMAQSNLPVLGIGTEASHLPLELVKVGRLEKEFSMLPPSQRQRELILENMLTQLVINKEEKDKNNDGTLHQQSQWAELLATLTAGCVAADLRRLCADAWNRSLARSISSDSGDNSEDSMFAGRDKTGTPSSVAAVITWEDLAEAARNCVPSQLAALDVTKPKSFLSDCSVGDWSRIHELSWNDFAGYASVKKRVYRTVVVPWRRHLSNSGVDDALLADNTSKFIAPPSGVLFHGTSGCGKTLAANCLGSSLGLPMIKVRAADVLDKWLGGSEAAIRSLFNRARGAAPAILLFDEIDAIASNRSDGGETADVMSRLLSTLLNEMDGVSSGQARPVLVVACTNRLESLDAALLRPGRLEEHISLEKPTLDDAKEILRHCLARAPLDDSLDLDSVAAVLVSKSATGALVEGTCREAVFQALRRCGHDSDTVCITLEDISKATVALKLA